MSINEGRLIRPDHYRKFRHYAAQLTNPSGPTPLPVREHGLPKKYQRMPAPELVEILRASLNDAKRLLQAGKVSKSNRLVDLAALVLDFLMGQNDATPLLHGLLREDEPAANWLKYRLVDLFEAECLARIRHAALEDTLDAFVAKSWLRQHGYH